MKNFVGAFDKMEKYKKLPIFLIYNLANPRTPPPGIFKIYISLRDYFQRYQGGGGLHAHFKYFRLASFAYYHVPSLQLDDFVYELSGPSTNSRIKITCWPP